MSTPEPPAPPPPFEPPAPPPPFEPPAPPPPFEPPAPPPPFEPPAPPPPPEPPAPPPPFEPPAPPPADPPPGTPSPLAEWVDRVVSTLIDAAFVFVGYIVLFVVFLIISAVSDTLGALILWVGYLALSVAWLYFGFMEGEGGQSPGKRLTGLKVVKMDGTLLGGGMGIVRKLAHIVDGFCFVGYLFPLWDPQKQTFADKMLATVVVKNQEKRPFGLDIFKV